MSSPPVLKGKTIPSRDWEKSHTFSISHNPFYSLGHKISVYDLKLRTISLLPGVNTNRILSRLEIVRQYGLDVRYEPHTIWMLG